MEKSKIAIAKDHVDKPSRRGAGAIKEAFRNLSNAEEHDFLSEIDGMILMLLRDRRRAAKPEGTDA